MRFQVVIIALFFAMSGGLLYNAVELRADTASLEQRRKALESKPAGYDYEVSQIMAPGNFEQVAQWRVSDSSPSEILFLVLPADERTIDRVNQWASLIYSTGQSRSTELRFATAELPQDWETVVGTLSHKVSITALKVKEPRRFSRLTGAKILPLTIYASGGKAITVADGQLTPANTSAILQRSPLTPKGAFVIRGSSEGLMIPALPESLLEKR